MCKNGEMQSQAKPNQTKSTNDAEMIKSQNWKLFTISVHSAYTGNGMNALIVKFKQIKLKCARIALLFNV